MMEQSKGFDNGNDSLEEGEVVVEEQRSAAIDDQSSSRNLSVEHGDRQEDRYLRSRQVTDSRRRPSGREREARSAASERTRYGNGGSSDASSSEQHAAATESYYRPNQERKSRSRSRSPRRSHHSQHHSDYSRARRWQTAKSAADTRALSPKRRRIGERQPADSSPPIDRRPDWSDQSLKYEKGTSLKNKSDLRTNSGVPGQVSTLSTKSHDVVQKNELSNGSHSVESFEPLIVEPMKGAEEIIEERRRQRQQILAKYNQHKTIPATVTEPQDEIKGQKRLTIAGSTDKERMLEKIPSQSPSFGRDNLPEGIPVDNEGSTDDGAANVKDKVDQTRDLVDEEASTARIEEQINHENSNLRTVSKHSGVNTVTESKLQDSDLAEAEIINEKQDKTENVGDSTSIDEDFDMFADTMPVDDRDESKRHTAQAQVIPRRTDGIIDNWDDLEGYYSVVILEMLDDRYIVQSILGKGMFATVIRAQDKISNSLVAIKIIRNNDVMRAAGLKEATILRKLAEADPNDRRHIVRIIRSFEHKNHLCLVFENLSMNLRQVLKKFGRNSGLNIHAVRAYAQQVFLGLALLRKCEIIHADLKPDNILVNNEKNYLKICDLGSASSISECEITPYLVSRFYRAPEVILGLKYDYGVDVWAIGCTIFELYTGNILFNGRSNNQMLKLFMECKGRFPGKLLRRAEFTFSHFDQDLVFQSQEQDKITKEPVIKPLAFSSPVRDIKARLSDMFEIGENAILLRHLSDLLERCLELNPERRITPLEALRHPFLRAASNK